MKNSEIAMVILIAAVSVIVSYFLGNTILGDPSQLAESISYMEPINSSIEQPDNETFNPYALNPTVEVYVGNCGPFEVWSESKHACVPREGFELNDEENTVIIDDDDTTSDDSTATGGD